MSTPKITIILSGGLVQDVNFPKELVGKVEVHCINYDAGDRDSTEPDETICNCNEMPDHWHTVYGENS